MELFLNWPAFEKVSTRYKELAEKNAEWAAENEDAIAYVKSNCSGEWEGTFDEKTKEIVETFIEYSEKVDGMNTTFDEATPRLIKMFNRCSCISWILEGIIYDTFGDSVRYGDCADDLMYDSKYHDNIITASQLVSELTDTEEKDLSDLGDIMDQLEHVDKTLINEDITDAQDGIKKQRYLEPFIESFQAYVGEVDDYNTTVGTMFADVVGEYGDFPVFSRDTDVKAYVDSHYSYITPARKGDSELYDAEGMYGGDQGDLLYEQGGWNLPWGVWFYNKEYYEFIRSQPGFENYTDAEIYAYMKEMNKHGCGYIGCMGVILQAYQGREEEFERKYGIPYYNDDGEINYDKFFILYYNDVHGKVFSDAQNAEAAYRNDIINNYRDDPDAFKQKYGVELFKADGETLTDEARQALLDEYNAKVDNGEIAISTGNDSSNTNDERNRLDHYAKEHGDSLNYETVDTSNGAMTQEEFIERTNNGEVLVIDAYDYDLFDENGKDMNEGKGSGHAMTITGVTSDGKYIVSSWGKEYYYDPNTDTDYYITAYKVERGE